MNGAQVFWAIISAFLTPDSLQSLEAVLTQNQMRGGA